MEKYYVMINKDKTWPNWEQLSVAFNKEDDALKYLELSKTTYKDCDLVVMLEVYFCD